MTDRVLHCWMGRREAAEEDYERMHGAGSFFGSDAWAETHSEEWKDGTCMLPDLHDGPHEFTDDERIGIKFADAKEPS